MFVGVAVPYFSTLLYLIGTSLPPHLWSVMNFSSHYAISGKSLPLFLLFICFKNSDNILKQLPSLVLWGNFNAHNELWGCDYLDAKRGLKSFGLVYPY